MPSYRSAASNSGTTASITVTKPAGVIEGDNLIAVQSYIGGSFSGGIPSGWTQLQMEDSLFSTRLLWKLATSSEGSNYAFGGGFAGNALAAIIVAVQDADGATRTSAVGTAGSSANVTAPTLTATSGDALIVRFGTSRPGSTYTPPASHTERGDVTAGGVGGLGLTAATADALAAAGAVGTANFTAGTSPDARVGYTVAFYPIPAGGRSIYVPVGGVRRASSY